MKFITYIFILVFMVSCEENKDKDKRNTDPLPVSGEVISFSDCKFKKSALLEEETPDTLSCIEYHFDASDSILYIDHINSGFNCCPGVINCSVLAVNDTIKIEEFESENMCNCNCLFDVQIEVTGIEAKEYQLLFIEPYALYMEHLNFEIDLSKSTNGSHCVVRKGYPWGAGI